MSAQKIIDRLDGVKPCGPSRWVAKCPAHDDKNPSLSIRETDTGQILIYDFAGCAAADVVAAIGLSLADLFPAPLKQHGTKPTRPNHWHAAREALRTLHREVLIVAIGAENIAAGASLNAADRSRLLEAAGKIRSTAEVCT